MEMKLLILLALSRIILDELGRGGPRNQKRDLAQDLYELNELGRGGPRD